MEQDAQLIFEVILKETVQNCRACLEEQPNQVAHYSGCFFPNLDFDKIKQTIEDNHLLFSLELWIAVGKLIDSHNQQTFEEMSSWI